MWSEGQLILVGVLTNDDSVTRSQRITQQQFAYAIFDVGLDGTFQRTGAKLDVITFDGDGRPPRLLVTDRFAAEVGEVGDGGEVGAGEREKS